MEQDASEELDLTLLLEVINKMSAEAVSLLRRLYRR